MNRLLKNKVITELDCGANFAYILNNNSEFLMTDYKVLQSQINSGFIKCMKTLYNGKIQFFYMTGNLKNFGSMLASINTDTFMAIASNLFASIIEVKNNGFLSCQNIDISFEKIFIDVSTLKVSLVYIPISTRVFNNYDEFENELRTSLIKLINKLPSLSNKKAMQFSIDLSNGTYSLEDLYDLTKGIKVTSTKQKGKINNDSINKNIRIVAINAPTSVEILVDKNEYILGKNPSMADGVITFNKAISRVHCKIINDNGEFMVIDLNSANGTYVNRLKLLPNQPHPIKSGDVIRLANSDFQIIID
ncbi:FHA domain-containing protein [uncultured Clostridium sp.]|uniref:FHA domain-containing protein n=1 Tax=uncultured Clostridium sp. TaxID=59620 RepID=UPI002589B925|nr:FHA domain-containing protein [uncultured Clostridium sp.]